MAAFGAVVVADLIDALSHDEAAVRKYAAEVLGYFGSPDAEFAVLALGLAVEDPDAEVAISTLVAVGALSGSEGHQF
ncbi:HEAT repeat domain-containing protein [Rathayibacter iranicus]|uniref:HEAT repeat domain-containing protein n=1 Tax=Rathayibacter iranicus TaxID=59737 RepID=UPI001057BC16|nr:HEAT repeat domain-containing protein [Rathayibacter iranicus]